MWQELFIVFGGNAILLAAVAWLLKSLLTHGLQRDIRVFEADLKAKADTSIEQLRSALQLQAIEHQVRFSKLHEKRAEVIAELYDKLVHAFWAAQTFVSAIEFAGEPSKEEKYVEAMNKLRELYMFFERHKIYLPEALCTSLGAFIQHVRKPVIHFGIFVQIPYRDAPLSKEKIDAWIEAGRVFDNEIPNARNSLETEFRRILGEP